MNLPRHDSRTTASDAVDCGRMRDDLVADSRVAFFGGSFDPPHLGHLAVARAARAAFALDKVLFAPVGMQPLKKEGCAASFEDRLAMTRLAIADEQGFEVSLADAPRGADGHLSKPNYSIETLQRLRSSLPPGCTLFCLMGADSFLTLHHWFRAAEIPFVAPLIVASRPGQLLDKVTDALPAGLTLEPTPDAYKNDSGVEVRSFAVKNTVGDCAPFYVLPGLHVEISASQVRAEIRERGGAFSHTFRKERGKDGAPATARTPDLVPVAVRDYIARHKLYGS